MKAKIFVDNFPCEPFAPVFLSAPHGGRKISDEILETSRLSETKLLATSDLWTDVLVRDSEALHWIAAEYTRTVVDLNRDRSWLDPKLVEGAPKHRNAYIDAGYGVIPRFADRGCLIRNSKLSQNQAERILSHYHDPFHLSISKHIEILRKQYGWVLLLDIHSAPAKAMKGADIVIGTNYGRSSDSRFVQIIQDAMQDMFSVVRLNDPFAGGYITSNYGHPDCDVHAIQIEFSRRLVETKTRDLNQEFLNIWRVLIDNIIDRISRETLLNAAAE